MQDDSDVTRRTLLAAERTWLAWWRSGIAAATAAVAVGGVVPGLVGGSRTPYIVIGAGYAALAIAMFACAFLREQQVRGALQRGDYAPLSRTWLLALTVSAVLMGLATLVVIVIQP
jgi:inner membrane protein YidH